MSAPRRSVPSTLLLAGLALLAALAFVPAASAATPTSISGLVTDSVTHAPVKGITVSVSSVGYSAPIFSSGTTHSNGRYTITGLTPGTYTVSFFDDSASGGEYLSSSLYDVVVRAGVNTVDEEIDPALTLSGKVTDLAGKPLRHIYVNASSGDFGSWGSAQTRSDGRYLIEGLRPGTFSVDAFDPDGDYDSQTISAVTIATPDRRLNIKLKPAATLQGTVTDATGAPVKGIALDLSPPGITSPVGYYGATTNSAGRYLIAGVKPGDYLAMFSDGDPFTGGDFLSKTFNPLTIAPGANTLDVRLDAAAMLTGRVRDGARNPIRNIAVTAIAESGGGGGSGRSAITRRDGSYAIAGLAPGPYTVVFEDRDGDFQTKRMPGVTVALPKSALNVKLTAFTPSRKHVRHVRR